MEATKNYIYVFTDTTKPGNFVYNEYVFEYEPFYVGVSSEDTIHKREQVHIRYARLKKDVTKNKYKMNIINKIIDLGLSPVVYRVHENMEKEKAFELEKHIISIIGNRYDESGPLVNISAGGEGGDNFTNNPRKEEIREKHRQNALGSNNNMYGLPLEMRPSHIAKINGCHWNTGRKASPELREIFSNMRKGGKNITAKKTLLFDSEFNFIKEFDCCFDISDYVGSSKRAVSFNARRNSKSDIPYYKTKGYHIVYKIDWESKFKDKEEEIKEFLNKKKTKFS